MQKIITFMAFMVLVVMSTNALCKSNVSQPTSSESKEFERAKQVRGTSNFSSEYYEFEAAGYQYRINRDGSGTREHKDMPTLFFDIDLLKPHHEQIDAIVYYAEFKGDLLLICGTKLDDSGSAIVRRLRGDSLKIKWKQRIKAFNVGPGLIKGDYAYLTAIGFVGKINLVTGKYAWKHDGLYRSGLYNSFQIPSIIGDRIRFKDKDGSAFVEVDDRLGKIIKVD